MVVNLTCYIFNIYEFNYEESLMMVSSISLIFKGIGLNGTVSLKMIKPYSNDSKFNAAQ